MRDGARSLLNKVGDGHAAFFHLPPPTAGDEMDPSALVCAPAPACLEASATAWPAWGAGMSLGRQRPTAHVPRAHLPYMACDAPAMFGNPRVRPWQARVPVRGV